MSDLTVINSPAHYLEGRQIEPIWVMEDWCLCHHLACVIKYLARCGRKENAHQDLLKAEWYLKREIDVRGRQECPWVIRYAFRYSLGEILQDWQLPHRLEVVLSLLKPTLHRSETKQNLEQALSYLQEEIQTYEGRRV